MILTTEERSITLDEAKRIIDGVLLHAAEHQLRPLTVAVLDATGNLKALCRQDGPGASIRPQIAIGKAFAAISFGQSSRTLGEDAAQRPQFVNAVVSAARRPLVPVAGGLVITDPSGVAVGSVGVSGDSSDNDELAAIAGIRSLGFEVT